MGPLLAALLAAAQPATTPAGLGRTAWLFSTIGQSEWCPAGNVRINLRTGGYSLTVRARRSVCEDPALERPVWNGVLPAPALARLRLASERAINEGLQSAECAGGKPPPLVIANGGAPVLILVTGRDVARAPDELGCWSAAGNVLHEVLDDAFDAQNWP